MRNVILFFMFAIGIPLSSSVAQEHEKWLGPQKIKASYPRYKLETKEDRDRHIPEIRCSLKVMRGKNIKLPKSANPPFTVRDGKYVEIKPSEIGGDRKYLFGLVDYDLTNGTYNYYIIRARVTEGKLKGATINFLNEYSRFSISDPTVSVFENPEGMILKEGEEIPFEIREIYRK